jgi:exonuclease III
MSWNCQSVRNKRSELSLFVEKNKIDIILLSETWLSKTADFFIPLFECYRVDRSHGGVAILIKHSIPHSSVRLISLEYAEAVFIKIHDSSDDFSIGAIYCSPAASRAQSHAFFSRVLSLTGRSVISGDFNAKSIRWNSDKNCRKGSDLVKLCDSRLFSYMAQIVQLLSPHEATLQLSTLF